MADITIDAAVQSVLFLTAARGGIFWTSPTVGYAIYADSAHDLAYKKTLDGGATWEAKVVLGSGSYTMAYDCWADWQTPGDVGTLIHIAFVDNDTDDVLYMNLDTSDDSESTPDTIEECLGATIMSPTAARSDHSISITKAKGGNLAVSFLYTDALAAKFMGFYTSPDGDTWTSRSNPRESNLDHLLLFPGNEADTQDLWAAYWDANADILTLKTYDNSGNSWSEAEILIGVNDTANYVQMDGAIRHSDGHLILAFWSVFDTALADLRVWDINGAGSMADTGDDVLTNSDNSFLASVFIDQTTDDIYVAYARGTAVENLVKVFYKKSDDGGGTWSGETAMQANAEDDERWISCGAMKEAWGGKFLPVWFNDDNNDLYCNTDNAISIAAAGLALEKSLSDIVNISDALAMDVSLSKTDTLGIADTLLKAVGLNKADTVSIADSETKTIGLGKAETVAIADTIIKAVSLGKADTVTISDSFDRVVAYVRALADTVTITDSISKAVSIVKADTIAITDSIVVGIGYRLNIVLSDIVAITDRLVGELRIKAYLKQSISRMEVKGMDIAKMSIKRMGIDRMPLFRWIIRRWTA